jgi:4-hydroxy-tetrahydrodipicolinate reductase
VTTRVGVIGAAGRMGSEACLAIAASSDLELVAAVSPSHRGEHLREVVSGLPDDTGELIVSEKLDVLTDAGCEVVVELTGPATVGEHLIWLLEHQIHAVVGATGQTGAQLDRARTLAAEGRANALIAPNFAIGAVLLMQFAAEAARHLPYVEVVELHHDRKLDAPSGTALRTAELIAEARTDHHPAAPRGDEEHPGARGNEHHGVHVHSVRLPGLVASQEVIFGGEGQTLTLRHDSIDRSSFMPGVLLGCRKVHELDGLVIGLEHLL